MGAANEKIDMRIEGEAKNEEGKIGESRDGTHFSRPLFIQCAQGNLRSHFTFNRRHSAPIMSCHPIEGHLS